MEYPNEYVVSRIATQRNRSGDDHLEVTLAQSGGSEVAHNVFDPSLQLLLIAAFETNWLHRQLSRIHVTFDKEEIVAVRLGAK